MEDHRQEKKTGKYERDISDVLYKVHLLVMSGRSSEAQEPMMNIEQRVHSSTLLPLHRDYYYEQTEVFRSLGDPRRALESCAKAIDFNSRLGDDSDKKRNAHLLL